MHPSFCSKLWKYASVTWEFPNRDFQPSSMDSWTGTTELLTLTTSRLTSRRGPPWKVSFGLILRSTRNSCSFYFSSDHPIDPPKDDHDPWDCEFPEDCGYELKPCGGVYQVFKTKEDVANGTPIAYEYPDLDVFITDMHLVGQKWRRPKFIQCKNHKDSFDPLDVCPDCRRPVEVFLLPSPYISIFKVSASSASQWIKRIGCSKSCSS